MTCEDCLIFKEKEKQVLNQYFSAFQCAFEMRCFVKECKRTCLCNNKESEQNEQVS